MLLSLNRSGAKWHYAPHFLFCFSLFVLLLFLVWDKTEVIVIKGVLSYLFVVICVFSGRWCVRRLLARHNLNVDIGLSLLLIATLSLCGALIWHRYFANDTYFHAEILTLSTPIVGLLMSMGMLLHFLNKQRQRMVTSDDSHTSSLMGAEERTAEGSTEYFFVKANRQLLKVFYNDLSYAEASRNNTKVMLETKFVTTAVSFSAFEKLLPEKQFIRVHRSFIINLRKVSHIEGNRVYVDGHEIPIGESYRDLLFRVIKS